MSPIVRHWQHSTKLSANNKKYFGFFKICYSSSSLLGYNNPWNFRMTLHWDVFAFCGPALCRGMSPNMGRCIFSYQVVLRCLLRNINDQAQGAVLCNQSINGQLLRTSVMIGRFCFGALWNFCISVNCDSWAVEGKFFFWISLALSSLLSANLNPSFFS